jgi:hypothetical protein
MLFKVKKFKTLNDIKNINLILFYVIKYYDDDKILL